MRKKWNAIEILKYSRHDWLNKLQLIKGNLALDRVDRVNEIIEDIIIETKNEAKLSNLKAPQLASLLMMFNWEGRNFFLKYEVLGDERGLTDYDDELVSWCSSFFNTLNESVKLFAENHLILSIELSNEEVRFIFDFKGIIEDKKKILNYIEKQMIYSSINILEYEVHSHEMTVTTEICA